MLSVKKGGRGWNSFGANSQGQLARQLSNNADQALLTVTSYLEDQFRRNIIAGGSLVGATFEPNAPLTVRLKGSNKPLIDTSSMVNSITSRKIGSQKYRVEVPAGPNADKASFNEVGGFTEIDGRSVFVPPRPFLRPFLEHGGIRTTANHLFAGVMKEGLSAF